MKAKTRDHIKQVCDSDLQDPANMQEAQKLLRNIKPLKRAMENEEECPFEALEKVLKAIVKKYLIYNDKILTITDVTGGMSYHGGCTRYHDGKREWIFTVHSDTMYGYFVKLVLMGFMTAKEGDLEIRQN